MSEMTTTRGMYTLQVIPRQLITCLEHTRFGFKASGNQALRTLIIHRLQNIRSRRAKTCRYRPAPLGQYLGV